MFSQFFFNLMIVIVALFLSHTEDVAITFAWEWEQEIDDATAAEIEQESLEAHYNPEAIGDFDHNGFAYEDEECICEMELDDKTAAEIEADWREAYYPNDEEVARINELMRETYAPSDDESDRDGDPNYEAWL